MPARWGLLISLLFLSAFLAIWPLASRKHVVAAAKLRAPATFRHGIYRRPVAISDRELTNILPIVLD